jgi:hypothetical protein
MGSFALVKKFFVRPKEIFRRTNKVNLDLIQTTNYQFL